MTQDQVNIVEGEPRPVPTALPDLLRTRLERERACKLAAAI